MKTVDQLPPHSRIWIYQSVRELTTTEVAEIKTNALSFLDQWTSHGNNMDAAIDVLYNRFVIIAVDEQTAPASGCGIDKSVRFIQDVEKQFNVSLLDRMHVAYKAGDSIRSCSLSEFEKLINTRQVDENTIVFNNLVSTLAELKTNWQIPLKQSWHRQMFIGK
ncbi:MAG: ABC transporter ATPase [Bacteroidetes bacterium]|nr:ABC transporter ATPase [Bacteroidota bacterium]